MPDKATRGQQDYTSSLHSAAHALWIDVIGVEQFSTAMMNTVDRGLMGAFREGMAKCGFTPEEATGEEMHILYNEIAVNIGQISDLAVFIEANSKANGGKMATVRSRLTMWANRYPALRVAIEARACADKKRQWILGRTEEHCTSCYGFAGRVYRFSVWAANNALPQSAALCCHGFRCDCSLVGTEMRITPGPFPKSLLCG